MMDKDWWCDLFHAGGFIDRDWLGRLNWRCSCGRWSGHPVPLDTERKAVKQENSNE